MIVEEKANYMKHDKTKQDPTGTDVTDKQAVDPDDPGYVDTIEVTKGQFRIGLFKSIVFSAIAVLVFFIPVKIQGESDILFGFIYNFFQDLFGLFGLWLVMFLMIGNAFLSIYGKFFSKPGSKLNDYYGHDSLLHTFFYVLGTVYTVIYTMHVTVDSYIGPEMIVGSSTGGTVVPDIVLGVTWIIIVGAFFMPFLLNYGGIDFVGSLMEPLMRPLFKVPGKSAI